MGSLLYFAPNLQGISNDDLKRLGIEMEGVIGPGRARGCTRGPDGHAGITFVLHYEGRKEPPDVTAGYYPDRQTWEKAPGREYWIGYYNTEKPGPEDLIRSDTVNGYNVALLDGNKWTIPMGRWVRGDGRDTRLPRLSRYTADGWVEGDVLQRYQWIFNLGTRVLEIINGEHEDDITWQEQAELCAKLLAVNYHVGPCEIDLLRLISAEEQGEVLRMCADFPGWLSLKKKEADAIASLNPGEEDSSQSTNQPPQTS